MLCEARTDSNLGRLSSSVKLLWVILIRNVGIPVKVTQLQTSLQIISLLISLFFYISPHVGPCETTLIVNGSDRCVRVCVIYICRLQGGNPLYLSYGLLHHVIEVDTNVSEGIPASTFRPYS